MLHLREEFSPLMLEGPSKVMPLEEAVKRYVRPGMKLHLMSNQCRPTATLYEIFRQFHKGKPDFTLIGVFVIGPAVILFHNGMVTNVITSFLGDAHPFPGPNPVYMNLIQDGRLRVESWSLLSLTQRLMAGAMNIGLFPTRSIIGSSMADENRDNFTIIDNPFEAGGRVAVLKPLRPDLSLVHGLAADPYGNTILSPPVGEEAYGAFASHNGTLVTVEKIVSTDFIRKYSHFVKVPGHLVKAVCQVPYGAHPNGINNQKVPEVENYSDDIDFFIDVRNASSDPMDLDIWIEDWVLSCKDHGNYLKKLGFERMNQLRGKTHFEGSVFEAECLVDDSVADREITNAERMVLISAQIAVEKTEKQGYKIILGGAGLSNLSAWVAHYSLIRRKKAFADLVAEWGFGGYHPQPANPFLFNDANSRTCKFLSNAPLTLGALFSGYEGNQCLGMLGGAQIDKMGNLNSTQISPKTFLVGSGGGNDVACGVAEIVAIVYQSVEKFVERVPYITSPGTKVTTVVSQLGVFEKIEGGEELYLTGYFAGSMKGREEDIVCRIRDNCGWELKTAPQLTRLPYPKKEEALLLRMLDPKGHFLKN